MSLPRPGVRLVQDTGRDELQRANRAAQLAREQGLLGLRGIQGGTGRRNTDLYPTPDSIIRSLRKDKDGKPKSPRKNIQNHDLSLTLSFMLLHCLNMAC